MKATPVAFRLSPERLQQQLAQFNARSEVRWFGFIGALQLPSTVTVSLGALQAGVLGGGGTSAINGGVIAAGFDAAFVLAGLAQYDTEVVVTAELSVKFLSLAVASQVPVFSAGVVRSSRRFSFVEGVLAPGGNLESPFALASGIVAPAS